MYLAHGRQYFGQDGQGTACCSEHRRFKKICKVKTFPCRSMYPYLIKDYEIIFKEKINHNKLKVINQPIFFENK